ncbi:MAG: flagellar basal body L-ring protein FlgH [Pseudomonadota bacterium]
MLELKQTSAGLKRAILTVSMLLMTTACAVAPNPSRPEPVYTPVWPEMVDPTPASAGSLYQVSHNLSLFGDRRAARVGDVITISLEEQTRSSKSAETSIRKDTSNELLNPKVFGSVVRGVGDDGVFNSLDSSTQFSGEGESDQSNSLTGTITAVVAKVLPNGLLLVQGEKWFQLNRGEEYVRISGLVRAEDINSDNSVSSLRLADARIAYSGTGEIAQANQAGWLTRFFVGTLNPF